MRSLAILLLLLLLAEVYAQGVDDFGLADGTPETLIETNQKSAGFLRKLWRKSMAGSIGHASILGLSDDYRGYSHLRLRFDHSIFPRTQVVLEGLYEFTHIRFLQELVSTPDPTGADADKKKERILNYQKHRLRAEEAYFDFDILDSLTFTYGLKKIVWGQFEPYSPANFIFPFNLSTTDIEFSKVKGSLPQEVLMLTFYPINSISLSLYAFPRLTLDEITSKQFDHPGEAEVDLPTGAQQWQKAARLMFFPAWGTFGFSFYDGYNTTQPFTQEYLTVMNNSALGRRETLTVAKTRSYSAELAIPMGNWTFKAEYALIDTLSSLHYSSPYSTLEETQRDPPWHNYLQTLLANDGKLFVPVQQDILAVGTTAQLKRWYLNLVAFYFSPRYSKAAQKAIDLKEKVDPEKSGGYQGPIFPGIVASYYLNDKKDSEIGVAVGIISNGRGVALFYRKKTDSLVYGLGLQSIEYFSDSIVAETGTDEGYEKKNNFTIGMLASLTYKF